MLLSYALMLVCHFSYAILGGNWSRPSGNTVWNPNYVKSIYVYVGYHGVASSIPPSDLPTLSVVGESEVTISIKHW